MKKAIVILMILFFCPQYLVFASVEINEIMYDLKTGSDSGREWVEVYNNSDTEADTSLIKFFENGTNHKLVLVDGDEKIKPGSYAVIVSDPVKFKIDWPNFSGSIFDSTFSLNNNGEALALKKLDKNSEIIFDEFTYKNTQGAAGDGNSLQKINGVWIATAPTPGVENRLFVKPKTATSKPLNLPIVAPTAIPKEPIKNSIQAIENQLPQENNTKSSRLLFVTTLIGLIFIGSRAVYFIRRKNTINDKNETGENFEILE